MKNKSKKTQLSFTKKTLVDLNENDMRNINAGGGNYTSRLLTITIGKTGTYE